jgi:23S rRNA pseudouridine1911/1915/1917 synthase
MSTITDAQDDEPEIYSVTVDIEDQGGRFDKVLATLCPDFSRSRLQGLIDAGEVQINGAPCTIASRKMKKGEVISFTLPETEEADPQPENIPLDIVYEDKDVIIINKRAGMVVHPAAGNYTGTLVNALLYHCGDTLSGINGVRRPGIVHRLDKETSGLMIVAKNDHAHHALAAQLVDRSLSRVYLALVHGVVTPPKGTIETQMGRHPSNRLKQAVLHHNGRIAITHYVVRENFHEVVSLVECRLATGRTHQIRVHMSHIGHPLLGDPLYGGPNPSLRAKLKKAAYEERAVDAILDFPRQALHAAELAFIHPASGKTVSFKAPLPDDMDIVLQALRS